MKPLAGCRVLAPGDMHQRPLCRLLATLGAELLPWLVHTRLELDWTTRAFKRKSVKIRHRVVRAIETQAYEYV